MEKQLIKEILLEQRQEIGRIFRQKIVGREAARANKDILGSNLIKVITGVRRCGKSVFVHQLFKDKDYAYVNFDDERLIGIQANSLNDFLECAKELQPDFKSIFLDEIQNVTGWELFVNRLKRQDYNLVVTGSNSKLLSRDLATHLTGRHFSVELYPFSFKEFLDYRGFPVKADDFYITEKRAAVKKFLEEYLNYGGFPEIFKLESKAAYLRELYDKIIMRDIILRYSIKYSQDLKEMALYAFSNFASRFSFNKIKNIFEIKSVHTVKNYINYLEEAYLLFQLTTFSRKLKEQIKLPKKIYCIDTGMINSIVSRSNFDYGRLIENLVFLELKRRRKEIY
ncbi:MAG: ATP-binding protein, partial [Elusimicrobia bacterium]|nr:ATP-binding protein [Elusimicrobiota bacterium]